MINLLHPRDRDGLIRDWIAIQSENGWAVIAARTPPCGLIRAGSPSGRTMRSIDDPSRGPAALTLCRYHNYLGAWASWASEIGVAVKTKCPLELVGPGSR